MKFRRWLLLSGLILLALCLMQCSRNKIRKNLTAEERMAVGKQMFEKGDYLDARTEFQVLVVSGAGTAIADEAQFYLAECYFHLKDYVTAVSEYQRLIRMFPNSPWLDDAQYKIGLSYSRLSPKPGLDQEFTRKALQAFQVFLEDYPNSELRAEVEKHMQESREKLAEKEYKGGELYRKMGYSESALIYYDSVLQEYYDTKWAEKALYKKAKVLERLEKPEEALETYQSFLRRYPQSSLVDDVRNAIRRLREHFEKAAPQPSHPGGQS